MWLGNHCKRCRDRYEEELSNVNQQCNQVAKVTPVCATTPLSHLSFSLNLLLMHRCSVGMDECNSPTLRAQRCIQASCKRNILPPLVHTPSQDLHLSLGTLRRFAFSFCGALRIDKSFGTYLGIRTYFSARTTQKTQENPRFWITVMTRVFQRLETQRKIKV